jgi:hypothetical protein
MNKFTRKFAQALDMCNSLENVKSSPSSLVYEALTIFCEIGREPLMLMQLISDRLPEVKRAFSALRHYAASADNWKIQGFPFGVKDQASILGFFLQLDRHPNEFEFFTGNFKTPEDITQLLKEWKGIDMGILKLGNQNPLMGSLTIELEALIELRCYYNDLATKYERQVLNARSQLEHIEALLKRPVAPIRVFKPTGQLSPDESLPLIAAKATKAKKQAAKPNNSNARFVAPIRVKPTGQFPDASLPLTATKATKTKKQAAKPNNSILATV